MRHKVTIFCFYLISALTAWAQEGCYADYGMPVKKLLLKDGSQLAYVEKGKGKPIIFIHGLGGNISHWIKNLPELSGKYRCIAVDLPGYGYSIDANKITNDHLAFYADAIFQLSKQLALKNISLTGISMGGQIAVIAGLQHPELFKKLILINPAGLETFTEKEKTLLSNLSTQTFFKNQDETTIRRNYKNNFYDQPSDLEKLIQYRLSLINCPQFDIYTASIVKGIQGMLSHPIKNDLSKLKQRVLLVMGENDNLIPNRLLHPALKQDDIIKVATDNIKRVGVLIIPLSGHMLAFEEPHYINLSIKNFIN